MACSELRRVGFNAEHFDAVDMRERAVPETWQELPRNLGSTLSWLKILEHAASSHELFLVFEDDIYFRYDTIRHLPALSDFYSIDFDCIYLTGHYAKGGTRVPPRRISVAPGLVRAIGIHTLPARLLTRRFAKALIERINNDMRTVGRGADRADAILSSERRKTYALESHIGGQRSGDRRSWEPRAYDMATRTIAHTLTQSDYPCNKNGAPDYNDLLAIMSLTSRFKEILVINGCLRTIAGVSESVVDSSGRVLALNISNQIDDYKGRLDDRLTRYVVYGNLSYCTRHELPSDRTFDCVVIECNALREEEMFDSFIEQAAILFASNFLLIFLCREEADVERMTLACREKKYLHIVRTFRSFGRVFFCNTEVEKLVDT